MSATQILIVEDEGIVAKDLQVMLRRLGYHVPVTAGTGDLAIRAALENKPDLILMDIQLRGAMDGVQAAEIITSELDVPIVYLTANSDESTLRRAQATAPFAFLVKPFEERGLQAGIEMALYKHRTDRGIREREEWLSTTLSSIADAVITTDAAGRITFLNSAAEKLCGWTRAEALNRPYGEVFRILDDTSRMPCEDRVATALELGASASMRNGTVLVGREKAEIHIEHSVAPLRKPCSDGINGCVIVFSDVTERRALEEQLRHAQKMDAIGKLAGGIAHDFNNAITAIIGYAEMILREVTEADALYSDAKQILRAAEHSARLTHQLLAFSRKQVLQPRRLDLIEELHHMEGMVRRLVGADVSVRMEADRDLWSILADPGQIQQVLINLVVNARDAMPKGGELRIALRNCTLTPDQALIVPDGRPGEFVLLTVADTGVGMSPEVAKRIFEPFFTTKEPGKGTGLGLATCHGIVRQTSGMISVGSELGVGTTFSVYLPRAHSAAPVVARLPEKAEMRSGNETILLVEDEEILREFATEILESLGYRVLPAADGAAAVERLARNRQQRIDLVLTDLVMPRMNGRELAAWISENIGKLPTLFMSGYTDDEIIRSAVHDAEIDYLQKPFTPSVLAQRIREILDRRAPERGGAAAA